MVDLDPQAAAGQGHLAQGSGRRRSTPTTWPIPTGVARIDTHEYPVTLNNTPLDARRVQRHPDQGRRRRDDLHARRRPGPRRLHDADHGRPPQRQPRGPGDAPQERQRLDARHRQPGQGDDAADQGRRAARACDIDLLFDQSLFVTAAIEGVVHREHHRRPADRDDDPALPRKLAEHADRGRVDSAVDPVVDRRCCICWAIR